MKREMVSLRRNRKISGSAFLIVFARKPAAEPGYVFRDLFRFLGRKIRKMFEFVGKG